MALSNHERVGKSLELLRDGLRPYVERELKDVLGENWPQAIQEILTDTRLGRSKADPTGDVNVLLVVMDRKWGEVFRKTMEKSHRSLVNELLDVRNRWAHQEAFSSDDVYRALDSAERLLLAFSAPEAEEVRRMKLELHRVVFDEQVRQEKRRSAGSAVASQTATPMKPWREVVTPHRDVLEGSYRDAEFAADLYQVFLGKGGSGGVKEYHDPVEFFRRTYLTASLKGLLVGAVRRMTGKDGDPVVRLQTNFGGGKTHSMLALFHLFSGAKLNELVGVEEVMKEAGAKALPPVRRVVLVGNKISPGNPATKPDGTVVRTLWGELAWQLGGAKAFARVKADDERATNPGDALRELFNEHGPCVILIDEWVAYARQLHERADLPGGDFETHFTFAQALTESAKDAKNCLLVVSLPASEGGPVTSPHARTQTEDMEVGGTRGREALERLSHLVQRLEASWRPATPEEGFEIVRRRLFETISGPEGFTDRDVVARTFADFYRAHPGEFPSECRDAEYEKRIKAAYPIHPEIFDRLYGDWSTLIRFQRTRGVLRLMATVIHELWENGDRNPLILPGTLPLDASGVQSELTRHLSDNWAPVLEKDVDGVRALPLRLDAENPNFGKLAACRRVARTIFLGSAPTMAAAHKGLEDRRVKLGCAMPGESIGTFGDALRRLAGTATYLYQDGSRYWYSTQPTVTKLAEDRAEQLKRDPDKVAKEIADRVRKEVTEDRREKTSRLGDFSRVHALPQSGADVPDDPDARLVVLGVDHPHSKGPSSPAEAMAKEILETRGTAPRLCRNALVFLAADKTRLQDLEDATRRFLAWKDIVSEKTELNLDPHQLRQAETQRANADQTVTAQIPETYQWLLYPKQASAHVAVEWEAVRLTANEPLAARASRKLRSGDQLIVSYAGNALRHELDGVPLWRGDHVAVQQLVEDFARYPYLPRLKESKVLLEAIRSGAGGMSQEFALAEFALAESFDEKSGRYAGLLLGSAPREVAPTNLLVKADVAARQIESDKRESAKAAAANPTCEGEGAGAGVGAEGRSSSARSAGDASAQAARNARPAPPAPPKRFHGSVALDPNRVGRDAGRIADEVISHLSGLVGAKVTVRLEISAEIPEGASDHVVRTVTENARTLKFSSQGFERE